MVNFVTEKVWGGHFSLLYSNDCYHSTEKIIVLHVLTFSLQLGKYFSNHLRPLNCAMNSGIGVGGGGGVGLLGGGVGTLMKPGTGDRPAAGTSLGAAGGLGAMYFITGFLGLNEMPLGLGAGLVAGAVDIMSDLSSPIDGGPLLDGRTTSALSGSD